MQPGVRLYTENKDNVLEVGVIMVLCTSGSLSLGVARPFFSHAFVIHVVVIIFFVRS